MLNIVWTEPPTNIEEHILSKESPSFLQSSRLEVDHIQIHQIWKIFWMIWKISKNSEYVPCSTVADDSFRHFSCQICGCWLLHVSKAPFLYDVCPPQIILHQSSRIITNHHESGCHTMPYHAAPNHCRWFVPTMFSILGNRAHSGHFWCQSLQPSPSWTLWCMAVILTYVVLQSNLPRVFQGLAIHLASCYSIKTKCVWEVRLLLLKSQTFKLVNQNSSRKTRRNLQ